MPSTANLESRRRYVQAMPDGDLCRATLQLLTKLLAEAPAIDEGAMDSVSKLCDDENRLLRQVGMSCLRALIVHHQKWRSECLHRLLRYTGECISFSHPWACLPSHCCEKRAKRMVCRVVLMA